MFVSPAPSRTMAENSASSKTLKSSSKVNVHAQVTSGSAALGSISKSTMKSATKNNGGAQKSEIVRTPAKGVLPTGTPSDGSNSASSLSSLVAAHGYISLVKKNGQLGSKFPMTKNVCVFGRERTCDIAIQLPDISKMHARLEADKNGVVDLVNLTKTGTTAVSGVALAADDRVEIKNNDIILLGDRSFHFQYRTCTLLLPVSLLCTLLTKEVTMRALGE
jgi:pSer/pThr/pTyr-binding forkhead associated (FHA) protein